MIHRYLCFIIALLLILGCHSCYNENRTTAQSDEDYYMMDEPDITKLGLLSSGFSDILGFSMETDYTSIEASIEKSTYSVDFDEIKITVVDNNPGKAFWLFTIPFLKHQNGDEMIVLPFNSKLYLDVYGERDLWGICGIIGNDSESNKTMLKLRKKNYVYSFVPGTYIICIYVGERVIELPITLE